MKNKRKIQKKNATCQNLHNHFFTIYNYSKTYPYRRSIDTTETLSINKPIPQKYIEERGFRHIY